MHPTAVTSLPNDWHQAAQNFVETWQAREVFEGALLTGSYVIGTATPESDIDIHIVLAPGTQWRERGNTRIDGYLIEYFANPPHRYPMYLQEDLKAGRRAILTQLSTGEILCDKNGEVAKLVAWAEQQRDVAKLPALNTAQIELLKYHLWDELDGLTALYRQSSPLFDVSYGQAIGSILKAYASFLQAEVPGFSKIHSFFTDPTVAKAYRMESFPDSTFVTLFIASLEGEKRTRFEAIRNLTAYILEKMGGFEISNWSLRSSVN